MGTTVTVSGINYTVPAYNDTGWAQGTGNVSQLLIALAAVTASTPSFMQTSVVTVSPTTLVSGHTYLVNTTSGAFTLNLPSPAVNAYVMVKDYKGAGVTNPITLHRAGSESIDGVAADATLAAPYGGWCFFSDGTDWFSMFYV